MRLYKSQRGPINAILMVLFLSGCGTAMDSVRAWRQHGEEPARIDILLDRIDDLSKSLELVHQLLFLTRYEPGAQWIKGLGLSDQKAAQIRSELEKAGPYADPDFVVPVARIYREHVRRVLASTRSAKPSADDHIIGALNKALNQGSVAASWSETRRIQAKIARTQVKRAQAKSRLDAVKKKNKAQRKTLQKALDRIDAEVSELELQLKAESDKAKAALEQSDFRALKSPSTKQLYTDLVTVISVAARLEAEALALAPVIVRQLSSAAKPTVGAMAKLARDATLTVANLKSLGNNLRQQVAIIFTLANKLCDVDGLSLSDTPGFLMTESAADTVKGFALDSLYFEARAGGEALFFHVQELDEKELEADEDGVSYNLTGRRNRLEYDIKPIVLASFKLDAGIDLMGVPGFINFDLGYKTDRVYQSGGSVQSSTGQDLLRDLDASGLASDVLSFGAAVMGIKVALKKAVFNSGEVRVIEDATGGVLTKGPLRLDLTQFDLTYDTTQPGDFGLRLGFRYMNYKLPRILYEFRDDNPSENQREYVYVRESPVQQVQSEYYLLGANFHGALRNDTRLSVPVDIGIHLGGGPTNYYMTTPSDSETEALWTLAFSGKLGLAYRIGSTRSLFKLNAEIHYQMQLIKAASNLFGGDEDDTHINFGGSDIFHGPQAQLRMVF